MPFLMPKQLALPAVTGCTIVTHQNRRKAYVQAGRFDTFYTSHSG